jgi:RNA polymerase sigma-70 factor (ECF subfamily)
MPPLSGSPTNETFDRWVSEHAAVLYRVAFRQLGNRHDAEDVVQDAFRSAWLSRHLYDHTRSERAWLLAILKRRASDHWRKRVRKEFPAGNDLGPPARDDANPFDDELSAAMQAALGCLPAELKETLLLVVVGELTHQEAADLMGIPIGTVLSRVSRARSRLREQLLARPIVASDHATAPPHAASAVAGRTRHE